MKVLPNVIGNYISNKDWNIEDLKLEVHRELKELDHEEFLKLEEQGDILFDSIVLINYEHYANSNNRIYIFLDVDEDEEGQFVEYGIGLSVNNELDFSDTFPLGKEEELFDEFFSIVERR